MLIYWKKTLRSAATGVVLIWSMTSLAQNSRYLITNNDFSQGNSATFFKIASNGRLTQPTVVPTGGNGWDGLGGVVTNKINISHDANGDCAYLSEFVTLSGSQRPGVTAISILTKTVVGNFPGSTNDKVQNLGLGLASNASNLYADFSQSQTIGTYKRLTGCQLSFLGDISAHGLAGGTIFGLKANRNILVVTYTDGSIESFNIASGTPVPNGDLQYSTAHTQNSLNPSGLDITADGHYAIFGDAGDTVEVSDISGGSLAPTIVYSAVGTGSVLGGISLSPDGAWIYLTSFNTGEVSAAVFNKTTGTVSPGCTSAVLNGFNSQFSFLASVVTELPFGTGSVLYTADPDTRISALKIASNGSSCTLTEPVGSPFADQNTITLESIGVFPPRRF